MSERKRYNAEEKVAVLMELLKKGKKVSDIAEEYSVHPTMIMKWEKQLFEGAIETFTITRKDMTEKAQNRKIEELEKKLAQKDMVIAELATENLGLKKNYSGPK
ncbi:MAG: transposase [Candidatus Kryptoniota bacterium]